MITAMAKTWKKLGNLQSSQRLHDVSKSGCMIKLFHENRWLQSTDLCFPFIFFTEIYWDYIMNTQMYKENTDLAYFRKSILFGKHNGSMRNTEETQIVVTRSMYQGLCVQYQLWAANKKTEIKVKNSYSTRIFAILKIFICNLIFLINNTIFKTYNIQYFIFIPENIISYFQ